MKTVPLWLVLGACTAPPGTEWQLVWSEDFDGPAGQRPDPSVWIPDVGGDGWGNNQLEFNTDRADNAQLDGEGVLRIIAKKEDFEGNAYTSARLTTKGTTTVGYGRIEARIKLPAGQGLWPAFWMLGTDIDEVSWPNCGEIDIMEFRGENPGAVLGTIHGPGYSAGESIGDTYVKGDDAFAADFHVFAVEVDPDHISWWVDDVMYQTRHPGDLPDNTTWVFDHEFFLILNLAVGGNFLSPPTDDTPFPSAVEVDYVRIYERPIAPVLPL